jgi:hypothetical protein
MHFPLSQEILNIPIDKQRIQTAANGGYEMENHTTIIHG